MVASELHLVGDGVGARVAAVGEGVAAAAGEGVVGEGEPLARHKQLSEYPVNGYESHITDEVISEL